MTDEIKIGVIGTGMIGMSHLKTYAEIPGAKVVAICDINRESVDRAAKEFGIPHACTDFRELLARKDIAAVDVCLHNNLHPAVSIAAMEAGKDVYCEKPLASLTSCQTFDSPDAAVCSAGILKVKRVIDMAERTGCTHVRVFGDAFTPETR